jgi:hypothetical protein
VTDGPEITELTSLGRHAPEGPEPRAERRPPPQRDYAGAPACVLGTEAPGDGYLPCNLPGRPFRYERPDQTHRADQRVHYCPGHEAHAATIGMVPAEDG